MSYLGMQYQTNRLATFQDGVREGRSKNRQYYKLILPDMHHLAEFGFYFTPTKVNPDQITCFCCKRKEKGIEGIENIAEFHLQNNPKCAFAYILMAQYHHNMVEDDSFWESERSGDLQNPFSKAAISIRRRTFGKYWHFDVSQVAATSLAMASAGFFYCPVDLGNDRTQCVYCNFCLEGWSESDDPLEEHLKYQRDCYLLRCHGKFPEKHIAGSKRKSSKALELIEAVTTDGPDAEFVAKKPVSDVQEFTNKQAPSPEETNEVTDANSGGPRRKSRRLQMKGKEKLKQSENEEFSFELEDDIDVPKASKPRKRSKIYTPPLRKRKKSALSPVSINSETLEPGNAANDDSHSTSGSKDSVEDSEIEDSVDPLAAVFEDSLYEDTAPGARPRNTKLAHSRAPKAKDPYDMSFDEKRFNEVLTSPKKANRIKMKTTSIPQIDSEKNLGEYDDDHLLSIENDVGHMFEENGRKPILKPNLAQKREITRAGPSSGDISLGVFDFEKSLEENQRRHLGYNFVIEDKKSAGTNADLKFTQKALEMRHVLDDLVEPMSSASENIPKSRSKDHASLFSDSSTESLLNLMESQKVVKTESERPPEEISVDASKVHYNDFGGIDIVEGSPPHSSHLQSERVSLQNGSGSPYDPNEGSRDISLISVNENSYTQSAEGVSFVEEKALVLAGRPRSAFSNSEDESEVEREESPMIKDDSDNGTITQPVVDTDSKSREKIQGNIIESAKSSEVAGTLAHSPLPEEELADAVTEEEFEVPIDAAPESAISPTEVAEKDLAVPTVKSASKNSDNLLAEEVQIKLEIAPVSNDAAIENSHNSDGERQLKVDEQGGGVKEMIVQGPIDDKSRGAIRAKGSPNCSLDVPTANNETADKDFTAGNKTEKPATEAPQSEPPTDTTSLNDAPVEQSATKESHAEEPTSESKLRAPSKVTKAPTKPSSSSPSKGPTRARETPAPEKLSAPLAPNTSPIAQSPALRLLRDPLLEQIDMFSANFSNVLEASTPHQQKPTFQSWVNKPLAQLLEVVDKLEAASLYLTGLVSSSSDLHNDFDGQLTAFISSMPEEEEEMTVQEWVRHNASMSRKVAKETCTSLIESYKEEYARALKFLDSLPTEE